MPVMQEDTYQITIVYYLELDHISFYLCSTTSENVCFSLKQIIIIFTP